MDPIEITLLDGSNAGRARPFENERLTFGRTPDNDIVIDVPHVSRRHGGLEYRDGQWYLISVSPNGTTVNGKRVPEKTPHPLQDGDVVGVGRQKLFSVGLGAATEPAPEAPAEAPPPEEEDTFDAPGDQSARAQKRKSALYIGIGVYVVLTLVGGYILSQMMSGSNNDDSGPPDPISEQVIREEIQRPIQTRVSAVQQERFLQDARRAAARRDANPTALWEAYINYKRAVAASEDGRLDDPADIRKFDTIEQEMIQQVQTLHDDAYALLKNGQFQDARRVLDRLIRNVYRDGDSKLGRRFRELRAYADRRAVD